MSTRHWSSARAHRARGLALAAVQLGRHMNPQAEQVVEPFYRVVRQARLLARVRDAHRRHDVGRCAEHRAGEIDVSVDVEGDGVQLGERELLERLEAVAAGQLSSS